MIFRRREQAVIEIRRLALTQLPLRDRRIERIEGNRRWKRFLRGGAELRAVKFLEKISENSLRNEAPEVLRHKKPLLSISFHARTFDRSHTVPDYLA